MLANRGNYYTIQVDIKKNNNHSLDMGHIPEYKASNETQNHYSIATTREITVDIFVEFN